MTNTVLSGLPISREFDNSGIQLGGGLLYTYSAGSTTFQPTYQDLAGTVQNSNPIQLDSAGRATVRYSPGVAYKLVLTDPTGNTVLWSLDNYYPPITDITQVDPDSLGSVFWPQTTQESAAGITPVHTRYQPGDIRRYGGVGDNSTDDTSAISNALATGHTVLGGGPQYTYRYTSSILIATGTSLSIYFDGQGCTLKPVGSPLIGTLNPSVVLSTTVVTGDGQGAIAPTLTSVTGLVAGQICLISATSASYPTFFATIKSIVGSVVTLDTPFPYDYTGTTVTVAAYDPTTFFQRVDWRNIRYDMSGLTATNATLGMCLRVTNAVDVTVSNIEICNVPIAALNTTTAVMLEAFKCRQVGFSNITCHDNQSGVTPANNSMAMLEIDDCGAASITGCKIDGGSFGINVSRVQQVVISSNVLHGRSTYEEVAATPLYSTRGIKIAGCGAAEIIGNQIDDYVTPIKGDGTIRAIIIGNNCRNSGYVSGTNNTGAMIELTGATQSKGYGMIIRDNVLENGGGNGIVHDNGGGSTGLGRYLISGNYIRRMQGYAIALSQTEAIITGNIIEDWDLANGSLQAINYGYGATVSGNVFIHNTVNTKICLITNLQSTYTFSFRDNRSPTGNPLFASSLNTIASGSSTITSGNTSVVVAHGLVRTPTAAEIDVIPTAATTAGPGLIWVSTIGSTNFTVNCATNPSTSGLAFNWRAELIQPWTA